jgi:hypothetical protein
VTRPVAETQSFMYLETTIPAGMTIQQYRVSRPPRRSAIARLLDLARQQRQ